MEVSNQSWDNRKVTPWRTERGAGGGEGKQRMTYFGQIRARRDV